MFNSILNNKGISGLKTVLLVFFIMVVSGITAVYFFKTYLKTIIAAPVDHEEHKQKEPEKSKSEFEKEAEDFFADKPAEKPLAEKPKKDRKILFYRNPMNPTITSLVPAKDEMGMDYIPVYGNETVAPATGAVSDMAPLTLSQEGIELAGVITTPAVREAFKKTIRTVGQVTPDETRIHRVQTRVSGWVEKLYINFTGQMVTKATPLLSIYSPELLSSQEELLEASAIYEKLVASNNPEATAYGETLLSAARKRLELFEVPAKFIQDLEKNKKIRRAITLVAPVSGFVTGKEVFEGQRVEPGMVLFTISDLSRIWVWADFYEYEARELKVGQNVTLFFPYDPRLELKGNLTYIYPYLDIESRSLKAKIEFPNDTLILKPGMYVDVGLDIDLGDSVVVPDSAVMYSGERRIVFVNTSGGRFEPREVKIGASSSGRVQVLAGVAAGELVAVRANFLLDSESRLQAIIQGTIPIANYQQGGYGQ